MKSWIPKKYGEGKYKHLLLTHPEISGLAGDTLDQKWRDEMGSDATGGFDGPKAVQGEDQILQKTQEFFQPDKNFIVKAFESTRGRGMAGVITALSFDWGEATWDTTPGRRAPMWLKVSISFDPIHDLPLGIDHDGMLRSTAYNVGQAAQQVGGDPYYTSIEKSTNGNNAYYAAQSKKPGEDMPEPQDEEKVKSGGTSLPGF